MSQDEEYIDVSGEGIWKHKVGDKDCKEGWCDIGISKRMPMWRINPC